MIEGSFQWFIVLCAVCAAFKMADTLKKERLERERLERERLEHLEKVRIPEREHAETRAKLERLEKLEQEKLEQERIERERLDRETTQRELQRQKDIILKAEKLKQVNDDRAHERRNREEAERKANKILRERYKKLGMYISHSRRGALADRLMMRFI